MPPNELACPAIAVVENVPWREAVDTVRMVRVVIPAAEK